MPLSEDEKESKNDYEKLIEMERASQLTWTVLILTVGLAFVTLHVESAALPNTNLLLFIFGVVVIGIGDLCFCRIVIGSANIAEYTEYLKQISQVYKQEFRTAYFILYLIFRFL
jgi:hypothetical protein